MNRVVLIGRLTRDPELRTGAGDNAVSVCRFTLAVDRRNKDEQADFLNVVAFGKVGEICSKYLSKGRQTGVEGRIQTRTYENKKGEKVNVFEIVAENVDFIGSRQDQPQAPAPVQKHEQFSMETETNEDLPW